MVPKKEQRPLSLHTLCQYHARRDESRQVRAQKDRDAQIQALVEDLDGGKIRAVNGRHQKVEAPTHVEGHLFWWCMRL